RQPPGPERVATRPECQPSLVGRLALVVGCQPPVFGRLALVLGVAPGERCAALLRAPALASRLSRLLPSVSARAGRRPQPRPLVGRLPPVLAVAPGARGAARPRAPALASRLSRLLLSVSARAGRRPQPRPQAGGAARRRTAPRRCTQWRGRSRPPAGPR